MTVLPISVRLSVSDTIRLTISFLVVFSFVFWSGQWYSCHQRQPSCHRNLWLTSAAKCSGVLCLHCQILTYSFLLILPSPSATPFSYPPPRLQSAKDYCDLCQFFISSKGKIVRSRLFQSLSGYYVTSIFGRRDCAALTLTPFKYLYNCRVWKYLKRKRRRFD